MTNEAEEKDREEEMPESSPEQPEETPDDEEEVAVYVETDDEDEDEESGEGDRQGGLEEENASLKNMLLRARADLENFRKRSDRERSEHVKYANRKVFLEILDVLDNFDRALMAVTEPNDNFVIGVKMIQKQLMDVLGNNGVEIINAEGRAFDPYLDEAIAREATDEHEENTILEVFQKGFRFHGQLLRPTKVKVAVMPEEKTEDQEVTSEEGE